MALCPTPIKFTCIRPRPTTLSPNVSLAPIHYRLLPKIPGMCTPLPGRLSFRSPACLHIKRPDISLRLSSSALTRNRSSSVCYFSGNNNAERADEPSPWNSHEKSMGIEDLLRQQMQNKEYADDGSGGGSRFGGFGFGRGGDDFDDEGFREMLHEFWQVILATAGFIFLYKLIIDGEEITRMGKDILKFIFTRKKSIRLARTMDNWQNFFQRLARKELVDPQWLEREILRTPTWWHRPSDYRRGQSA